MAIALVNTTSGSSNGGGTSLAATAANHTAGNLLVVGVFGTLSSGSVSSLADTAGNTFANTSVKVTHGSDYGELWYAKNITGNASNVVTATYSGSSTFRRVMVHQYSGCDTSAPFTAGEGGTGTVTGGTSVTTSSWSTATADEVIAAFYSSTNGSTPTAGSGFTIRLNNIGTDTTSEDRIVSATGTYTASATFASQDAWMVAGSFKIAGGGGGGPTVMQLAALGVG